MSISVKEVDIFSQLFHHWVMQVICKRWCTVCDGFHVGLRSDVKWRYVCMMSQCVDVVYKCIYEFVNIYVVAQYGSRHVFHCFQPRNRSFGLYGLGVT